MKKCNATNLLSEAKLIMYCLPPVLYPALYEMLMNRMMEDVSKANSRLKKPSLRKVK